MRGCHDSNPGGTVPIEDCVLLVLCFGEKSFLLDEATHGQSVIHTKHRYLLFHVFKSWTLSPANEEGSEKDTQGSEKLQWVNIGTWKITRKLLYFKMRHDNMCFDSALISSDIWHVPPVRP